MGKPFLVEVESLAGGLNEAAAENLAANELSRCEDFHVDGPSLISREGYDEIAGDYDEDILSVFRYKPSFDTDETILLGCEASIARVVDDEIEEIPVLDGVYPELTARWWGVQYADEFFMCRRGNGGLKRLYGPSVLDAGLPAPTSPPTATDGGAGKKIAGVYRFAYRFYNPLTGARSNWSPLSLPLTIEENHRVILGSVEASTNPQVTARQIGATKPDEEVIFLVGQIDDNISTTFNENALSPDEYGEADSVLVNGEATPTTDIRNGVPPSQAWAVTAHKERLFVLNEQGVSWSEPGLPQSFKASSFIPVSKGNGLFSWDQVGLAISTDERVEILLGDTPDDWRKDVLSAQHRCASGKSMAVGDGHLFWYTGTNIVVSTGGPPTILPRIERIRETLDSIPDAQKGDVQGATRPSKGWYLLSVPTDDGRKVIIYDYVRSAFAVLPEGPQTLAQLTDDSGAEVVYAAFADDPTLYHYFTGTTDNGAAIQSVFRTAKIGNQDTQRNARFVVIYCPSTNRTATIRLYYDGELVATRAGVSLAGAAPKKFIMPVGQKTGTFIQVEIESSGTERLRIDRLAVAGVAFPRRVVAA